MLIGKFQEKIYELKELLNESNYFIKNIQNSKNSFKDRNEFENLKKVINELEQYILSIENCEDCICKLNKKYWCNLISVTIYGKHKTYNILDDYNFHVEEEEY